MREVDVGFFILLVKKFLFVIFKVFCIVLDSVEIKE